MSYWKNREERAKKAKEHTKEMKEKYKKEIEECVNKTKEYQPQTKFSKHSFDKSAIEIEVIESDVVDCILDNTAKNKKVAVLNFASYKNPGGKFIEGSSAQEETLCHSSFLYNVLSEFPDYYRWNREHLNRALYENRALYSQDVAFEKEGKKGKCDVLTCAAPNYRASSKYCHTSQEQNLNVLNERIKYVLDIFSEHELDIVILGAYGCGVFGQDPEEVARYFKYFLENNNYGFKKVIFPILKLRKDDCTYEKMKKVLIENNLF